MNLLFSVIGTGHVQCLNQSILNGNKRGIKPNFYTLSATKKRTIFADDSSFLRTLGLSTQTLRISIMIDTGVEKYILKYKSNSVNNSSYQPITLHRKEIDTVN